MALLRRADKDSNEMAGFKVGIMIIRSLTIFNIPVTASWPAQASDAYMTHQAKAKQAKVMLVRNLQPS